MLLRERVASLKTATNKIAMQYPDFIRITSRKLVDDIIVNEIMNRMRQNNFSEKIIKGVRVGPITMNKRGINIKIISEYFASTGFDVAVAREFGTRRHKIVPLNRAPNYATVLSWIQNGRRMFSKGHWVSGIKALRLVHKTIKEMTPKVQQELDSEFSKWKREIIKGSS